MPWRTAIACVLMAACGTPNVANPGASGPQDSAVGNGDDLDAANAAIAGPDGATDAADAGATTDEAMPQDGADSGAPPGELQPDGGDGDGNAADQAQDATQVDAQMADVFTDGTDAVDTSPTDLPDSSTADALPESIGKAPPIDVKPWPPPCEKPGIVGDGGKGYDGENCFGPPNYCMYAGGATQTYACSLDGQYCCLFFSTCVPCGWVSCFECFYSGTPCPDGCKANPPFWGLTANLWLTPQCKALTKIVNSVDCAVCPGDTNVYCKWQAPP